MAIEAHEEHDGWPLENSESIRRKITRKLLRDGETRAANIFRNVCNEREP
jgi:hypothetical protein